MKRLAAFLTLLAMVLCIDSAAAAPHFMQVLRTAGTSIVVPLEWDGEWTIVDSTYDCQGGLKYVMTGRDTVCGGQEFVLTASDNPYPLSCSGTATATTLDVTCTGGATVFPDCNLDIATEVHAVRNGDTYRAVTDWQETYSGTGEGCGFMPSSCERSVRIGTRVSPGPADYCLTAARHMTWGSLKMLYR